LALFWASKLACGNITAASFMVLIMIVKAGVGGEPNTKPSPIQGAKIDAENYEPGVL